MACNCKKQFKKMEKYADDAAYHKKKEQFNPIKKILQILLQLCFGIFCGAVIIVMIVPMLVYIIGCLLIGKEITFKLKNLTKKK